MKIFKFKCGPVTLQVTATSLEQAFCDAKAECTGQPHDLVYVGLIGYPEELQ